MGGGEKKLGPWWRSPGIFVQPHSIPIFFQHTRSLSTLRSSGNWLGKMRWKMIAGVGLSGPTKEVCVFGSTSLELHLWLNGWMSWGDSACHCSMISEGCSVVWVPSYEEQFLWKKKSLIMPHVGKWKNWCWVSMDICRWQREPFMNGIEWSSQKWYPSHSAVNFSC